jgi:hypothetical protein
MVNQLLRGVRLRIRLKKQDREMIGAYARLAAIPRATGKRRVSLLITLAPGQRAPDPDAFWKSTLDALVQAHVLLGDDRHRCELGSVTFRRGSGRQTTIVLEDLGGVRSGCKIGAGGAER